jgi:hypothetical protein
MDKHKIDNGPPPAFLRGQRRATEQEEVRTQNGPSPNTLKLTVTIYLTGDKTSLHAILFVFSSGQPLW